MVAQVMDGRETEEPRTRGSLLFRQEVEPSNAAGSAILSLRLCVFAAVLFTLACSSKPTDPRTVVPADALVYIETQDLGKALRAITDSEAFRNAAATQPNVSSVDGVRFAVAVTGFEGSRQDLNEEQAVGNIIPRFVAVAETNAGIIKP